MVFLIYSLLGAELFLPDEDDAVVAAKTISLHNCFVQFTSPELLTEMRVSSWCRTQLVMRFLN